MFPCPYFRNITRPHQNNLTVVLHPYQTQMATNLTRSYMRLNNTNKQMQQLRHQINIHTIMDSYCYQGNTYLVPDLQMGHNSATNTHTNQHIPYPPLSKLNQYLLTQLLQKVRTSSLGILYNITQRSS